ncbi:MAG TPA: HAD family hydrolase, partial [Anaerolineales bacterium]|nr:HAD family hydrolase [Anaerolineales bacterium]
MPRPNGIHTVLFDLDGTLRHNRRDATHTFLAKALDLGLADSPETHRQGMRWNFTYWADSDELKGDLGAFVDDETGFWLNYTFKQLNAFGCPSLQAGELAPQIHEFMAQEFDPEDIIPQEVPETLAYLKEAGYRTGVVSNRTEPFGEYLEEIGLGIYFDFFLAAGEANSWKPDAEIF